MILSKRPFARKVPMYDIQANSNNVLINIRSIVSRVPVGQGD